eukprot:1147595-Pelagomonas_calceolata.AAC.18
MSKIYDASFQSTSNRTWRELAISLPASALLAPAAQMPPNLSKLEALGSPHKVHVPGSAACSSVWSNLTRRHIGSKSRESSSPECKREASVGQVGFWKHAAPGH